MLLSFYEILSDPTEMMFHFSVRLIHFQLYNTQAFAFAYFLITVN